MSSLPKTKPEYPYHILVFTNRRRTPQRKYLYFKKSEFSRRAMLSIKQDLDLKYKTNEFDPWIQTIELEPPGGTSMPLARARDQYLETKAREITAATLQSYTFFLGQFLQLNPHVRTVQEITDADINRYINDSTVTYNTRRTRMIALRAWFNWLHAAGIIPAPPTLKIQSTRAERAGRRKEWITRAELEKIITALHELDHEIRQVKHAARHTDRNRLWMADLFRVAFFTGLRRADLMNMKVGWVQGDYIRIGDQHYRPKSQLDTEVIPIMPEIRPIIDRLTADRDPGERLFGHYREDWPSKVFKECVRRAMPKERAERLRFHNLRDSATMYWIDERGLPLRLVQQLLRHAVITTTEIYSHYNPVTLLRAVNGKSENHTENRTHSRFEDHKNDTFHTNHLHTGQENHKK